MSIKAFVIHLDRAVQRQEAVEAIKHDCPVPVEVFPAIDGTRLDEVELASVYSISPVFGPEYPFRLGKGEVACFLSHRAIWKKMIAEGIEQALVLEDDVRIGPAFHDALKAAIAFSGVEGFVQFQTRRVKGDSKEVYAQRNARIVQPSIVPLRTSAQLLGVNAARRLLEATERFDRPIDAVLQMFWQTQQPIHCAVPSGILDLTEHVGGSVAQAKRKRGVWESMVRTWDRYWYRRQIIQHSRRLRAS